MKWRNQLLAIFCLAAFAGFGVLYFQLWVVQKPFGIILFVGEGLAPSRLAATRIYAGGADAPLALDALPFSALLTNYSNDFAVPDEAAAATALATGTKVNNRSIGLDTNGKALRNIVELARENGRATGLVTDSGLTSPTVSAFWTHAANPPDNDKIARDLALNGTIDIALGGGAQDFLPMKKGGRRRDDADLLLEMTRAGADVVRTKAELEAIPGWRRPKLFGVFGPAELAFSDQVEARRDQPTLADMVRRAIELLQFNRGGYLLVVDASLMRAAAQENNGERTLAAAVELDRAVAVARSYTGGKATVIVCGDVAIGGMSLNGNPFRKDRGLAVLGLNSAGDPWLTWASGPNGIASYGAAKFAAGSEPAGADAAPAPQEPAAFYSHAALGTVEDMIALGSGPGADQLHGSLSSTAIFQIVRDNL